jgi:Putative zinc-finger
VRSPYLLIQNPLIQNTETLKMTSNFDPSDSNPRSSLGGQADLPFAEIPDPLKRDRFELLSAYLDGEVTAPERRQVEAWLKSDPKMQALYARMLKMQQGVRCPSRLRRLSKRCSRLSPA